MLEHDGRWLMGIAIGLLVAGCGGGGDSTTSQSGGNPNAVADGAAYFPLGVGAKWSYHVTNAAGMSEDHATTVETMEPAGGPSGPPSYRVRNEAIGGTTINWENTAGSSVVRYHQQQLDAGGAVVQEKSYMPSSLVFDESAQHLVAGATWSEAYNQTETDAGGAPKTSQELVKWTVEATDDMVTVAAGTFSCVRVRRHHESTKTPTDEVTWYAANTGRVKQTGGGPDGDQTRELVSFTAP